MADEKESTALLLEGSEIMSFGSVAKDLMTIKTNLIRIEAKLDTMDFKALESRMTATEKEWSEKHNELRNEFEVFKGKIETRVAIYGGAAGLAFSLLLKLWK